MTGFDESLLVGGTDVEGVAADGAGCEFEIICERVLLVELSGIEVLCVA